MPVDPESSSWLLTPRTLLSVSMTQPNKSAHDGIINMQVTEYPSQHNQFRVQRWRRKAQIQEIRVPLVE